jgi:hypothetical protein
MALVHSTTYTKILNLLSSYGGRDKLAKVIHYTARIAVWYFAKIKYVLVFANFVNHNHFLTEF